MVLLLGPTLYSQCCPLQETHMTSNIRKVCSSASYYPCFTVDFQERPWLRGEDGAKAGSFRTELKE